MDSGGSDLCAHTVSSLMFTFTWTWVNIIFVLFDSPFLSSLPSTHIYMDVARKLKLCWFTQVWNNASIKTYDNKASRQRGRGKERNIIMGGRRDGEMTVDLLSTILCKFSSMPPWQSPYQSPGWQHHSRLSWATWGALLWMMLDFVADQWDWEGQTGSAVGAKPAEANSVAPLLGCALSW